MNTLVFSIISAIGTLFAMLMSVLAIIRSSKQKNEEALEKIKEDNDNSFKELNSTLNLHIINDTRDISQLQESAKNIERMLERLTH